MIRLINIFLTSFLVVFFGLSLMYTQMLPQKKQINPSAHNKNHLALSFSNTNPGAGKKVN